MGELGDVSASAKLAVRALGIQSWPTVAGGPTKRQSSSRRPVQAQTQARGWPAHRCGIRQKPRTMGCPHRLLATHKVSACRNTAKGAVRRLRLRQGKDAQHEEAQRTQAGWHRCSRGLDLGWIECGAHPLSAAARQARPCLRDLGPAPLNVNSQRDVSLVRHSNNIAL